MRGGLTRRMVIASALLALLTSAAFAVLLLAIRDERSSAQLARRSQEVLAAANRVERLLVFRDSECLRQSARAYRIPKWT